MIDPELSHTTRSRAHPLLARLPRMQPGWVWLAGAGPGDPGLVTAQVLVGLESADVIVHDALVNEEILHLVSSRVHLHYAGKRGGKPSVQQADITDALIGYACEGRRVLRLKGGDPMVFARGAEEARALASAGIPFRILPSVSAGLAVPSYAGIPLTHRGYSSSVSFITGHGASGVVPEINWSALACGADVLVFFMAMQHLELVRDKLLEAGLPSERPAALVSRGTLPEQQMRCGTLGGLSDLRGSLEPPAIIVIGEVVQLADELRWFTGADSVHP